MIKRYYAGIDSGTDEGSANTFFDGTTFIADSSTFDHETANIVGVAGAVLTLQIVQYIHTNPTGRVQINGTELFLGMTFPITLDGSGLASFDAFLIGTAGGGGIVLQKITIVGMTAGFPSSPISYQISKVF